MNVGFMLDDGDGVRWFVHNAANLVQAKHNFFRWAEQFDKYQTLVIEYDPSTSPGWNEFVLRWLTDRYTDVSDS